MIIPAWVAVVLAIPVLLLGERLVRHVGVLSRFNIPAPVVGGLTVSLLVLAGNLTGWFAAGFQTAVSASWWTWLVTPEPEWLQTPTRNVNQPFMVAFFTCIGLNASWTLLRRGAGQVVLFLALAGALAVVQNALGVGLAKALRVSPLLGLACGSLSLTGGHGTALGFAGELEKAGLSGATVLGVAAATFGLVAGGLLGGPVGGALIRKRKLQSEAAPCTQLETGERGPFGILADLRAVLRFGKPALAHLLLVLAVVKLGAWVSYGIQQTKITFPVYMGAMILGVVVRNVADFTGARWIRTEIIDRLSAVTLGIFLAIAMMSLNLIELTHTAAPMLIILAMQVAVMALFAWTITFRVMGGDFDAAVMAGGHCGFGLGAMPNAMANMKALVERFGPAPRAFLVVPIVGTFLVDLVNAVNITCFLNLLKR